MGVPGEDWATRVRRGDEAMPSHRRVAATPPSSFSTALSPGVISKGSTSISCHAILAPQSLFGFQGLRQPSGHPTPVPKVNSPPNPNPPVFQCSVLQTRDFEEGTRTKKGAALSDGALVFPSSRRLLLERVLYRSVGVVVLIGVGILNHDPALIGTGVADGTRLL